MKIGKEKKKRKHNIHSNLPIFLVFTFVNCTFGSAGSWCKNLSKTHREFHKFVELNGQRLQYIYDVMYIMFALFLFLKKERKKKKKQYKEKEPAEKKLKSY